MMFDFLNLKCLSCKYRLINSNDRHDLIVIKSLEEL